MPDSQTVFLVVVYVWAVYATLSKWHADEQRRDLLTDMTQLIYDGTVTGDDLRRARGIDAIETKLEAQEADQ